MKTTLYYTSIFTSLFFSNIFATHSKVEENLAPYKELIEWGTFQGGDYSIFPQMPKSRYDTFKKAFELIESIENPIIVELGTSRSFNHGGLIGCNSDDPTYWMPDNPASWDWGAGFFTKMVAVGLSHISPTIYTLDICPNHINRCKLMTSDFPNIQYIVSDSVTFLKECNLKHKIHLLYLDTGDMTPIEPTARVQLEEAKVIVKRNLIADGGYILIDDVKNLTPKQYGESSNLGKSKYALPYLLENGFTLIMDEYQVLLQKRHS